LLIADINVALKKSGEQFFEKDKIENINVSIRLNIANIYMYKNVESLPFFSYLLKELLCINPNIIVMMAAKKPSIVKLNVAKIIDKFSFCGNRLIATK